MCYAILRVKYRDGSAPSQVLVEEESELPDALSKVKAKLGVAEVEEFVLAKRHARVEAWEVSA